MVEKNDKHVENLKIRYLIVSYFKNGTIRTSMRQEHIEKKRHLGQTVKVSDRIKDRMKDKMLEQMSDRILNQILEWISGWMTH